MKMKRINKKISIKVILLILGLVLFIMLIIPKLFEGKVSNAVKEAVSTQITGKFDFSDLNLSLFPHFPSLSVSLTNPQLISYVIQDSTELFKAKKIAFSLNLWDALFSSKGQTIEQIYLDQAEINLINYDSISANYLILKDSLNSESSPDQTSLAIELIKIEDSNIRYEDLLTGVSTNLEGIQYTGSFYSEKTSTKIKSDLSVEHLSHLLKGSAVLKDCKLMSKLNAEYKESTNTLSLSETWFSLNAFRLDLSGHIGNSGDSLITDLQINTSETSFKDLFSLLPYAYTEDYSKVVSSGTAKLNLSVKGLYHEDLKLYPDWNLDFIVQNGSIQYPNKPISLEKVFVNIHSENKSADLKEAFVYIDSLRFSLNNEPVHARIRCQDCFVDARYTGIIQGKINLSDFESFFPLDKGSKLAGLVSLSADFTFKQSDIENDYKSIAFAANALVSSLRYTSLGQKPISIDQLSLRAHPDLVQLNASTINYGASDFSIVAEMSKPFLLFSDNQNATADVKLSSNSINADELMEEDSTNKKTVTSVRYYHMPDWQKRLTVQLKAEIQQLIYEDYQISDMEAQGQLKSERLEIHQFSSRINSNIVNGNASFEPLFSYSLADVELTGTVNLQSDEFDVDKFLDPADQKSGQVVPEPEGLVFPDKMRLNINIRSEKTTFGQLSMNNLNGKMRLVDRNLEIEEISTQAVGGDMILAGVVSTSELGLPHFNFKYDLKKLKFAKTFESLSSVKKLAPIFQFIDGYFNSTVVFEGSLGKDNFPLLDQLSANGILETLEGNIQGFTPLKALAAKLKINELSNLSIKNTKNWFTIENGLVYIKDLKQSIDGMKMSVNGKHHITGGMDYDILLNIPEDKIKKYTKGLNLEEGLLQFNNLLKKAGINKSVASELNLLINMRGTMVKPEFNIKLVQSNEDGTYSIDSSDKTVVGHIKDSAASLVKSRLDEAQSKVNEQKNILVDSIQSKANQKIDELKDQAGKALEKEITNKLDSSLQKGAKDLLGTGVDSLFKGTGKNSVDSIKSKLKDWNPFKKEKK